MYYNVSIFRYDEEFESGNKYHFLLETILKNKFCPLYSHDLESNACIYKKKPYTTQASIQLLKKRTCLALFIFIEKCSFPHNI